MAWKKRSGRLKELAEGLVKVGAIQFGTFTLPDGRDSSYYINMRGLPSYPGTYSLVVETLAEAVAKKTPKAKAVCGVPLSGLALAAPVAVSLKKPLVYTRQSKKADGRVLEGEIRPGWDVVVVDDLATSGKTILSAVEAIEEEGGEVSHAVVLIDRLEGAREKLSKKGVTLVSITDMLELADVLFSMELLSEENLKAITKSVGAVNRP